MGVELNDDLVSTWVTGWARTHNYEVTHEGRVHTAQPTSDPEALEHVLYAPDEVELRRIASAVGRSPKRLLTVIAEPNDEVMDLRTIDGLELISDEEVIMIADMEHQDVEDPITPEEFTTSRNDFDEWTLFTVKHGDKTAARGRLAVVNGFSILDRIYTSPDYHGRAWARSSPVRCWPSLTSRRSSTDCWWPPTTGGSSMSTSAGSASAMCTSSVRPVRRTADARRTLSTTIFEHNVAVTPLVRLYLRALPRRVHF
ncbi:hypothetical protein [Nesterenkonia pannonica]|uniref:hypothetical protein n=1 Tax=Nesterenkonia pannonica TaxID=1548602 RepID=UPI002164EE11|nr:hypothetical protein [Nesterenkonia pannonica]